MNLLLVSLTGCVWVDNTDDLQKYVSQIRDRTARPIKPLPEFIAYEAFVYEGTRLRNPFTPVVQFVPDEKNENRDLDLGNTPAPDDQRLKSYLEEFTLKELKMVGNIAKKGESNWVLIVDTNGEIHRVTTGDYVGQDHGKVVDVSAQKIKIVETISNGRGGWITRPRSIELVESKNP